MNGEPNAVVYPPKIAGVLDRLTDNLGQPLPSFAALQKLVSNQVPMDLGSDSDESEAYVSDFSQCVVGMRRQLNIEINRQAGGDATTTGPAIRSLQVWIRGYLRADVVLLGRVVLRSLPFGCMLRVIFRVQRGNS